MIISKELLPYYNNKKVTDPFGLILENIDREHSLFPSTLIFFLKQYVIYKLRNPEYGGIKTEKEKIIEMIKSTDNEMVKLGCTIMRQKLGYGKEVDYGDGCL